MEIQKGTVVQLKSGGPNMTVVGFLNDENGKNYEKGISIALLNAVDDNTNNYVICKWFDNQSSYKTNVFHISTLEVKL